VITITVRGWTRPYGLVPVVEWEQEPSMPIERTLKLSSVAMAVMWTVMMWWWNAPLETVPLVILAVCGALVGLGWYWLYGKWFRWYFGR
jgi:hypothetical protein